MNYVGVLFGPEIDYCPESGKIVIDTNKIKDKSISINQDPEEIRNYVVNVYRTMMERGIKGCYVYADNENLRNYLKQFIDVVK